MLADPPPRGSAGRPANMLNMLRDGSKHVQMFKMLGTAGPANNLNILKMLADEAQKGSKCWMAPIGALSLNRVSGGMHKMLKMVTNHPPWGSDGVRS